MKAPPFAYARATSLADVFGLQAETGGRAVLLAGGQTLLAALAFRLSSPELLIDITHVPELKGVVLTPTGQVRIGALTTHAALGAHPLIRAHVPMIAEAVPQIAHAAVRNRGTIGGSLAYADAAAELPACCVALDAVIVTTSLTGERRIPAAQFFTGLFETALQDRELIAAVEFPMAQAPERSTVIEFARRAGDYAMAGLAARLTHDAGRITKPRLVLFGVGATPIMAHATMAVLDGQTASPALLSAAQAALQTDLDPQRDLHGGPDFKRHLARVLLARAIATLTSIPARQAA